MDVRKCMRMLGARQHMKGLGCRFCREGLWSRVCGFIFDRGALHGPTRV